MVNIVGEHSVEPPQIRPAADLGHRGPGAAAEPLGAPRRIVGTIAWDTATAVAKASEHPGQIATLILPGDTAWQDAGSAVLPPRRARAQVRRRGARRTTSPSVLRSGEPTLLILANKATRGRALELAGKVAAGTGARLGTQFFTARIERGAGRVPIERIPYAVAQATAFLKDFKHIVTVETKEPVAFFAYPGQAEPAQGAGDDRARARRGRRGQRTRLRDAARRARPEGHRAAGCSSGSRRRCRRARSTR
jgi:acetolactate synthase-1/2/3 large subunit